MKKFAISLAVLFVLCLSSAAKADTLTFQPNPVDLNDLDHHDVYTWRVDNVNLHGQQITGARITISGIANWDSNANRLFIHLLDTARSAGVASFQDEPSDAVPVDHIDDDFVDTRYHSLSSWLVAPGTADTFLTSQSFTTTPTNFVYNFTAAQVNALIAYISNGGNFALGFDPDCHFFNNGITLQIFTAPAQTTPEPATLALLGTGLAGLYARRRRRQARA
ncbi:MAG TPA: PEP-CTERM sorting domain-containing protein [Pyrinomonadaceae bacterium]|nr:PEP-CTERM sorting domain-containing protein [Pyrinomonadaceae bacterium]